jgi:hypothetical protein
MADVRMWQDREFRADFEAQAKARLEEIGPQVGGQEGVIAVEPESGEYFIGATLGKANAAAFAQFPDAWVYFVRLDNPKAAIALPTW